MALSNTNHFNAFAKYHSFLWLRNTYNFHAFLKYHSFYVFAKYHSFLWFCQIPFIFMDFSNTIHFTTIFSAVFLLILTVNVHLNLTVKGHYSTTVFFRLRHAWSKLASRNLEDWKELAFNKIWTRIPHHWEFYQLGYKRFANWCLIKCIFKIV